LARLDRRPLSTLLRVRALAVHEDVLVFVSGFWQTTATAIRAGDEGLLIDSPVLPEELDALPQVLDGSGFPVSGLLATHADWDHLLGRLAFPGAALGVGASSAERLAGAPGGVQRELREFDERWYVVRQRPLSLGTVQSLPEPGKLEIGEGREIAVLPAPGHTADGVAFWCDWLGLLVCGDYLSPVEIPMLSPGGSLEAYLETLARLEPLLTSAETVVPGHGGAIGRDGALRVLEEDRAYLGALRRDGAGAELPAARRTKEQRRIHAENVEAVAD
jgi:glyoxylase-like metal-dependent hydrolase (beta-lactamase superfamily II)